MDIDKISLRYAPMKNENHGNITLTPAFVFHVNQRFTYKNTNTNKDETYLKPTYIIIDAITGKEIK